MDTAGKSITCKAAVLWEFNKPLSIETIEVAPPKAGEVRIKVVANSTCHSDLHVMNGMPWDKRMQCPLILGHEGAGIVESVGAGVTDVQPGDHVIPLWNPQCRKCENCKSNRTNVCSGLDDTHYTGLMTDGTSRFTCNGTVLNHFMGCSTFSEYTVICDMAVCKINPEAPLDKVCVIGCGISTGYGAAINSAKVKEGSSCAVFGLGAVGLSAVMGCKAAGAKTIIAIDINPDKAQLAKKIGATKFLNPKDFGDTPIETVILKESGGNGVDYTFECIGNAATVKSAFYSSHKAWGVCEVVGITALTKEVSIIPLALVAGRKWQGSLFGGYRGKDDVPKLVEQYMNKELNIDDFISQNIKLEEVNEAFDLMREGKFARSVVKYD
ncbi:NAD/NADP dependent alcohol dehydrogenase [Mactra antiquata]